MEISKTRRIIGWVLSALPTAAMTFGGVNKLMGNPNVVELLGNLNLNAAGVGILALGCVAAYLIPKTSNIGFFLMCSYFGGVIVGEVANGEMPVTGLVLTSLLYVGTMLRKPELSGLNI